MTNTVAYPSDNVVLIGAISKKQFRSLATVVKVTLIVSCDKDVELKLAQFLTLRQPTFYFSTRSDLLTLCHDVAIEVNGGARNISGCILQFAREKRANIYVHNLGLIDCSPYEINYAIKPSSESKNAKFIIRDNYAGVGVYLALLLLWIHYVVAKRSLRFTLSERARKRDESLRSS